MATLSFKIRKTSDKGGTVQIHFNYGTNSRLRYSTGLKILNIKNWDTNKMRVRNVEEEIDKNYINNRLNDLQGYLKREYTSLLDKKDIVINNDILKEACDLFFDKTKIKEDNSSMELLQFYDWFIENYSTKPLMTTSKPLQKGTARTYKNACAILKRFNNSVYRLSFNKIDYQFYNDFLEWLYNQNYSANYIGTQIKILKTILNASLELGYHNNIECNKKYFKKPSEQIDNIYLDQKELQAIKKLDLLNQKTIITDTGLKLTADILDRARDLFLISANTGLRVSDFNRLKKENIFTLEGRPYLKIITKKTNKPITIPLNTTVNEIIEKREGELPCRLPDQHINYALKEIGILAKIDSTVTIKRTKGGIETVTTYKKHELITNHTGRRSFCTNAYLSDMPAIDIMAISGHSSEKVFYNYIKVNDLQRAIKISENNFFS